MDRLIHWIEAARLKTLSASITPVLIGSSLAYHQKNFQFSVFFYCLSFALLCQIGSNFANDYLDFERGVDNYRRKGPRRAVSSGLISLEAMRIASISILVVAFLTGLFLIPYGGYWLIIIGVASTFFAWSYTGGPYPLAYNGLGDIFVILFFGLIAVSTSFYTHTGTIDILVIINALACGFMVNNLLVINNIRDREGDSFAGKKTSVVRYGSLFGKYLILTSCALGSLVSVVNAIILDSIFPLIGVLSTLLCWMDLKKILTLKEYDDFVIILKKTGFYVFLYGIFVSIGFII